MNRACLHLVFAAGLLGAPGMSGAQPVPLSWGDTKGDAAIRRTDSGNNGPVSTFTVLPDIVLTTLTGWQAFDPCVDPYSGVPVPSGAPLMRLDVVFNGLVNPPGTIGVPPQPFDPFKYGPSPLYGFLELDIDKNINTGGEFSQQAKFRYLGNVARFGRRPANPLADRVARNDCERDGNCQTQPWFERSGADWALTLCGCYPVTLLSETGNGNGIFDAGETMRVSSRFFQRVGAYTCSSGMSGGSNLFTYDPFVELRFSHNIPFNQTTVSLVYGLDMLGAAQLACGAQQAANFNAGDHTSIREGLADTIFFAPTAPVTNCCRDFVLGWIGANVFQFLEPGQWTVRAAIFGTSYALQEDAFYVWTDTCFSETPGDLSGDGLVNSADRVVIQQRIAELDGQSCVPGCKDADGVVNNSVTVCNYGINFELADVTGDGIIGALDISFICPADYNGDGTLTTADFGAFQTGFLTGDPRADFNHDTVLTVADMGAFQTAFARGCP